MQTALHQPQETEIQKKLEKSNVEYRRLMKDHRRLDDRLHEIDQLTYQTKEMEQERKEIQKLKLLNKDRRAQLVRQALG